MRPDYYVPFKSAETIAAIATRWRHDARLAYDPCFDITDFIWNELARLYTQKGKLQIILFDQKPHEPPAYVKYNPLRLYADREIWSDAKAGEPMARFILAHEVGHIVLHDHNAKSFSANPDLRLRFPMKENRSEWQADTFGSYLLVSDEQVASVRTERELAITYGLPTQLAAERFDCDLRLRKKQLYLGEVCTECGNFALISNGIRLKCDTCGSKSGGSLPPRQAG